MQTFTIPDLIDKFAEFYILCPDKGNWHEEILKGNDPRYFRFLHIDALRKAFGLVSFRSLSGFPKEDLSEEDIKIRSDFLIGKVMKYGSLSLEFLESHDLSNILFAYDMLLRVRIDLQTFMDGPYYIDYPPIKENLNAFLDE